MQLNPLLAKALFTKVMGIDMDGTESELTPLLEAVAIVSAAVEYHRVGTEYELPISYGSGTVRYADDIYNACVADDGYARDGVCYIMAFPFPAFV